MIPDRTGQPSAGRSAGTLWSRAIFVSGMVLLVSLGLCGLNLVTLLGVNGAMQGPAQTSVRQTVSRTLVGFGYVELAGMALGALGLVISMIGAGIAALIRQRKS